MIVDRIRAYLELGSLSVDGRVREEVEKLAGVAFSRQFMEEKEYDATGKLWMSSCGKCPRQVAYSYHGFEKKGKEIDARAKMVFFYGDLIELMVVYLAKLGGANITAIGLNQIRAQIKIGEVVLSGRPDGLLIENGEIYLLESKSMTDFAFSRLEKGEVGEDYLAQVNANLEALGLKKCVLVGVEKNSGAMHELTITKDPKIVLKIKAQMLLVQKSTKENLPDRPYAPNEKGLLGFPCSYCAYWGVCWPTAEKKLVGSSNKLFVAPDRVKEEEKRLDYQYSEKNG